MYAHHSTIKCDSQARKPKGPVTQDEGQERQEAKTQDGQEDRRQETFYTERELQQGVFQLREKQG
ncbi:hypothetical protein AC791_06240 [Klebsiella sp. RIT-PI-d]|nr:hypothetical protein AC791_06240 [Klebsiella sp. RIT-PI-d]